MARKKRANTAQQQNSADVAITQPEPQSIEPTESAATPEPATLSVTARCEEAKEETCGCRCRGKYHSKQHPTGWKDEAGCEPLNPEERKVAKREALKMWRRAHPERVSAYMKNWRATSDAPTAKILRESIKHREGTKIAAEMAELKAKEKVAQ